DPGDRRPAAPACPGELQAQQDGLTVPLDDLELDTYSLAKALVTQAVGQLLHGGVPDLRPVDDAQLDLLALDDDNQSALVGVDLLDGAPLDAVLREQGGGEGPQGDQRSEPRPIHGSSPEEVRRSPCAGRLSPIRAAESSACE